MGENCKFHQILRQTGTRCMAWCGRLLCEVNRWRFVTLFKTHWIDRFKNSLLLASGRRLTVSVSAAKCWHFLALHQSIMPSPSWSFCCFWHHRLQHLNHRPVILVRYPWIHGSVLRWFKSYLSSRSFRVKCDNNLSCFHTSSCGVPRPQGFVFGPPLFIM